MNMQTQYSLNNISFLLKELTCFFEIHHFQNANLADMFFKQKVNDISTQTKQHVTVQQ